MQLQYLRVWTDQTYATPDQAWYLHHPGRPGILHHLGRSGICTPVQAQSASPGPSSLPAADPLMQDRFCESPQVLPEQPVRSAWTAHPAVRTHRSLRSHLPKMAPATLMLNLNGLAVALLSSWSCPRWLSYFHIHRCPPPCADPPGIRNRYTS